MTLTILVGNTNTRLTRFHGRRPTGCRVIKTDRFLAAPERFCRRTKDLEGIAFASVVPAADRRCRRAIREKTGLVPFVLGPATRTGLRIHYNRSRLGADRVCIAVGGRRQYPNEDIIVIDFGTAVTVNVVNAEGHFLGGTILPGIHLMLTGLHESTARLPRVLPRGATRVIRHDTESAMQSGALSALVGGLSRIVLRTEIDTGRHHTVITTGGGAVARHYFDRTTIYDRHLAARGLNKIHRLNRPDR